MRSTSKKVLGGFGAGIAGALALAWMVGTGPAHDRPALDPRIAALLQQIKDADDRLAEAQSVVVFWQRETSSFDSEVVHFQKEREAGSDLSGGFFLGRAQGLAGRAANSLLDARLNEAMWQRKCRALRSDLTGP